jgi:hypothetical protein
MNIMLPFKGQLMFDVVRCVRRDVCTHFIYLYIYLSVLVHLFCSLFNNAVCNSENYLKCREIGGLVNSELENVE